MPESTISSIPAETHTTVSDQTECASVNVQHSRNVSMARCPRIFMSAKILVFADGNGVTGVIGNNDNKGDQDAHEATTSMQSKPDGKTKNSSSDRSQSIAPEFPSSETRWPCRLWRSDSRKASSQWKRSVGTFPSTHWVIWKRLASTSARRIRGCRNFRFHARRESQEGQSTSSSPFDVSGPSFVRLRELWTLASELLLEPGPPFSSLNAHRPPQVADGEPHTRTFWIRGGQRFPWPISKRRATTSSRGAMSASSSRTPRSRDKKSAQKPSRRDGRDQSQKQGARRPR